MFFKFLIDLLGVFVSVGYNKEPGHRDVGFQGILSDLFSVVFWGAVIIVLCSLVFSLRYADTDIFINIWMIVFPFVLPVWIVFLLIKKTNKQLHKKPHKIYTTDDILKGITDPLLLECFPVGTERLLHRLGFRDGDRVLRLLRSSGDRNLRADYENRS